MKCYVFFSPSSPIIHLINSSSSFTYLLFSSLMGWSPRTTKGNQWNWLNEVWPREMGLRPITHNKEEERVRPACVIWWVGLLGGDRPPAEGRGLWAAPMQTNNPSMEQEAMKENEMEWVSLNGLLLSLIEKKRKRRSELTNEMEWRTNGLRPAASSSTKTKFSFSRCARWKLVCCWMEEERP